MCKPESTIKIPLKFEKACDAVATLFLQDRTKAIGKVLSEPPQIDEILVRQRLIEHLKDSAQAVPLNTILWGGCIATEVWTDKTLATLQGDLTSASIATGERWSLEIIPKSLAQTGHHFAIGRVEATGKWWLVDPYTAFYIFSTVEELAKFTKNLLDSSPYFNHETQTVLLKITGSAG